MPAPTGVVECAGNQGIGLGWRPSRHWVSQRWRWRRAPARPERARSAAARRSSRLASKMSAVPARVGECSQTHVTGRIESTRALDGQHTDEWDGYNSPTRAPAGGTPAETAYINAFIQANPDYAGDPRTRFLSEGRATALTSAPSRSPGTTPGAIHDRGVLAGRGESQDRGGAPVPEVRQAHWACHDRFRRRHLHGRDEGWRAG